MNSTAESRETVDPADIVTSEGYVTDGLHKLEAHLEQATAVDTSAESVSVETPAGRAAAESLGQQSVEAQTVLDGNNVAEYDNTGLKQLTEYVMALDSVAQNIQRVRAEAVGELDLAA